MSTDTVGAASLAFSKKAAAFFFGNVAVLAPHLYAIALKKRLAFVLHVIEGYSLEEVATLMKASRSATKSRVFWARRELLSRARRDVMLREMLAKG